MRTHTLAALLIETAAIMFNQFATAVSGSALTKPFEARPDAIVMLLNFNNKPPLVYMDCSLFLAFFFDSPFTASMRPLILLNLNRIAF